MREFDMATLNVYWQHTGVSHDAGRRDNSDIEGTQSDATRTGVLSDEHQEVTEGRPVLVEDATRRVYKAADLPPSTQVIVSDANRFAEPIIKHARQAGFEVAFDDQS